MNPDFDEQFDRINLISSEINSIIKGDRDLSN